MSNDWILCNGCCLRVRTDGFTPVPHNCDVIQQLQKSMNQALKAIQDKCVDVSMIYRMNQTIETWQKGCEVLISDIQSKIRELQNKSKSPYKCPICEGYGSCTKPNYQDGGEINFKCHACEGKGIVWG